MRAVSTHRHAIANVKPIKTSQEIRLLPGGLGFFLWPLFGRRRPRGAGALRRILALQISSPPFAFGSYAVPLSHSFLSIETSKNAIAIELR